MKTNKKGFTLVELVIVIAVIAILAAVLIPTFSGIIARANANAAKQRVVATRDEMIGEYYQTIAEMDKMVFATEKGGTNYYFQIDLSNDDQLVTLTKAQFDALKVTDTTVDHLGAENTISGTIKGDDQTVDYKDVTVYMLIEGVNP